MVSSLKRSERITSDRKDIQHGNLARRVNRERGGTWLKWKWPFLSANSLREAIGKSRSGISENGQGNEE